MSDTGLTVLHPVGIKVDLRNVDFRGLVEAISAAAARPECSARPGFRAVESDTQVVLPPRMALGKLGFLPRQVLPLA